MDETAYLLSSPANAEHLRQSIAQLDAGNPPKPPIVARMVPAEKRAAFLAIRNALFDTGYLTGDQADVWAWRVVSS